MVVKVSRLQYGHDNLPDIRARSGLLRDLGDPIADAGRGEGLEAAEGTPPPPVEDVTDTPPVEAGRSDEVPLSSL